MHFPYHHKDSIEFLSKIKEYFKPDRVVNMGDLMDMYSVSSYPKDMNHPDSWSDELKKARKNIKDLAEIFPEQVVLDSNHDSRAYRKSRAAGVPREFLVPYLEVIGAPEGWKIQRELRITIDDSRAKWLMAHTLAGGSLRAAQAAGCSVALGHSHTMFGAQAAKVGKKTLWAVDTGCMISDKGSPYKYNKTNVAKPIQGCIMLIEGTPMLLPLGGLV